MLLTNASPIAIQYRDGSKETVNVSELSLRKLHDFIDRLGDTPALVAITVGKPVEWIDTLTDESFGELTKKVFELNFQRALTMAAASPAIAAKVAPTLTAIAEAADALAVLGKRGNELSLALAVSESAEATGNGSST